MNVSSLLLSIHTVCHVPTYINHSLQSILICASNPSIPMANSLRFSRPRTVNPHRSDVSPPNSSSGSSPSMSHSSSSPAPPSSPSPQQSPKNCSYIYRDWLPAPSKSMSAHRLPLRRSDPSLPSTSTAFTDQDHEMYSLPYAIAKMQHTEPRASPDAAMQTTGAEHRSRSGRKKASHRHQHQHQHRHHSHSLRSHHSEHTPSEHDSHRDDDDLFASTATNLLSSLKQPSKMTFNWSRQFNETLATISGLLQRNFEERTLGCNVSEASASTATLGSTTQMDALSKVQVEKWQRNRRTSLTGGDPRELDILVLEKNNGDDSDDYWVWR